MGKRKERRMAALSAAGRRVKLDLFVEPSGDMVGTSSYDEVGGDLDQNHHDAVPTSPSSSGKRQENPLLLLGQYSDDELDEEDDLSNRSAAVESSSFQQAGELAEADSGGSEDRKAVKCLAVVGDKEAFLDKGLDPVGSVNNLVENDIPEREIIAVTNSCNEPRSKAQTSDEDAFRTQSFEDKASEWKVVMHEQSNRYYYWNIVTGETSWEVPGVLVHEAKTNQQCVSLVDEREGVPLVVGSPCLNPSKEFETDTVVSAVGAVGPSVFSGSIGLHADNKEKYEGGKVNQEEEGCNEGLSLACDANDAPSAIIGPARLGSIVTEMEHTTEIAVETEDKHCLTPNEDHEGNAIYSVRLIEYCKILLQKLKALEGLDDCLRSKYILEVEIRLSDCKALSSCGPSLVPFWVHAETQLKQLEISICKGDSRPAKSENPRAPEIGCIFSGGIDNSSSQCLTEKMEMEGKELGSVISSIENTRTSNNIGIVEDAVILKESLSSRSPNQVLGSGFEVDLEQSQIPEIEKSGSEQIIEPHVETTISHAETTGEDIDMDVDMEVDDETQATECTNSGDVFDTKNIAPSEDLIPPNLPSLEPLSSILVNEFYAPAPPPPEEDWIPPPPPDNEQIPPPPPDEPPLPPYPSSPPYPSHGVVAPLPYTEQYNLAYPGPSFDYYIPPATEVNNYYSHSNASQIVETQQPFYEPVSNAYAEAAPAIANPMEPVPYYEILNGTVPVPPVMSTLESSVFYDEPGLGSYHDNVASDRAGSVGVVPEAGLSNGFQVGSETLPVISEAEMATVQVASTSSATVQAAATVSLNENVAVASSGAAAKNLSKVVRSKKRTVAVAPALRSNRKVSSLVDKWKAAKEELHGDEEDESENAYLILEKKRQREIEEWRAQQIASGGARDNANFLPLGGDWRERVKRKKAAESTCDAVETPPEVVANKEQQPDLLELSKTLPSGWQAFWDESSKQVYYGNMATSETTWTRPSN